MRYSHDDGHMYMPAATVQQQQIETAISHVQKLLAPDVVRIKYELGQDWTGDAAIFFRIVVSDDAGNNRLREVRTKLVKYLGEYLDFVAMGVLPYHNFRSESEQAEIREEAWA